MREALTSTPDRSHPSKRKGQSRPRFAPWARCLLMVAVALVMAGYPMGRHARATSESPAARKPSSPEVASSAKKGADGAASDPGTVVVRFRSRVSYRAAQAVASRAGGRMLKPVGETGYTLISTAGKAPAEVVRRLQGEQGVEAAEPNYRRKAAASPNDPRFTSGGQSYLDTLGMPSAWDRNTGSDAVTVAILDTGVDLDHPDLSGNTAGGEPRILPGYDFVNRDGTADDDNGHGTMVAGTAAAKTDNGLGVAGTAWKARILPVKVLNSESVGFDSDLAEGIRWAADRGADVINMSFGAPADSAMIRDAVNYGLSRNAVVVAAAGNYSSSEPFYPAAYPGVMGVTATDSAGHFAAFSNHGPWYSVAAPGIRITSTHPASGPVEAYSTFTGTSFSAPLVSGMAVLLRSANPGWTQDQVVRHLRATARDAGPRGRDDAYGDGFVDPTAALGGTPLPPLSLPPSDGLEPNDALDRASPLPATAAPTISPEGDVDWFYTDVNINSLGSATFTVEPPPAGPSDQAAQMDPLLEVYGPDHRLLGQADDGFDGDPEQLRVPTTSPGRYYLRVRSYNGSTSPGPYSVSAFVVASAWSQWEPLGGQLTSGPAVASWTNGRLDTFVRGTDNALWHKAWTGSGWTPWTHLGGQLTSDPAAVSWGPDRLDVVVRGLDNALWHKAWDGSGWTPWTHLGGQLTSGPAIASWERNRLDVVVRGNDNALWHKAWTGSGWTPWTYLGGHLTSDPAAVSWGPNRLDVTVRGLDNALWHKAWDGSRWTAWTHLGGQLTSGPAMASRTNGRLDTFVRGTDNALWHKAWTGSGWTPWTYLGGHLTSDPAAVSWAPDRLDVFVRGLDNAMWHKWWGLSGQ